MNLELLSLLTLAALPPSMIFMAGSAKKSGFAVVKLVPILNVNSLNIERIENKMRISDNVSPIKKSGAGKGYK